MSSRLRSGKSPRICSSVMPPVTGYNKDPRTAGRPNAAYDQVNWFESTGTQDSLALASAYRDRALRKARHESAQPRRADYDSRLGARSVRRPRGVRHQRARASKCAPGDPDPQGRSEAIEAHHDGPHPRNRLGRGVQPVQSQELRQLRAPGGRGALRSTRGRRGERRRPALGPARSPRRLLTHRSPRRHGSIRPGFSTVTLERVTVSLSQRAAGDVDMLGLIAPAVLVIDRIGDLPSQRNARSQLRRSPGRS